MSAKKRSIVEEVFRKFPDGRGWHRVKAGTSHDTYEVHRDNGDGSSENIELNVRRVDPKRNAESSLQIEISISRCIKNHALNAKRKETYRRECSTFCLPWQLVPSFIKSISEIAPE